MESKFENVTGHAALSDDTLDDSEGTVYWTFNETNEDGTSGWPGEEMSRKLTSESFRPDDAIEGLCKNNQTLSVTPEINNAARRRFENPRYHALKYGPIPFAYGRIAPSLPGSTTRIGYYWEERIKRIVVQEED